MGGGFILSGGTSVLMGSFPKKVIRWRAPAPPTMENPGGGPQKANIKSGIAYKGELEQFADLRVGGLAKKRSVWCL